MGVMSGWLEDVKVRLKDAELGGLGTRDAVGEDALQADNTAKLVYNDLPALIAKVEELMGALEALVFAARGVPHNGDNLVMNTLEVAIEEAETALRAPGGGAQ